VDTRSKGRIARTGALAAALTAVLAAAAYRLAAPPPRPSPPPARAGTAAHLTAFEGTVKVKLLGRVDWVAPERRMPLSAGDLVMTAPRAAAEITYADGFVVRVLPDTLLTIEPFSSEGRATALELRAGTIVGDAIKGGASSVITTGSARWEGSGDAHDPPLVDIRALPSTETTIDERRGRGRVVARDGQARVLPPHTRVVVDAEGRPAATTLLPAAPILLAPPSATALSYRDVARGVTHLVWSAVPEAASYHLLMDHGAFFLDPVVDRRGIRQTSWDLTGVPEGRYYWKVAAVARDGAESFSEFARFTLAEAEAAAPVIVIDVFERKDNVLHVAGRTDPGTRLTVNGQVIDVRADGVFDEFIALPGAGAQRVRIRAVGRGGQVMEETRSAS